MVCWVFVIPVDVVVAMLPCCCFRVAVVVVGSGVYVLVCQFGLLIVVHRSLFIICRLIGVCGLLCIAVCCCCRCFLMLMLILVFIALLL